MTLVNELVLEKTKWQAKYVPYEKLGRSDTFLHHITANRISVIKLRTDITYITDIDKCYVAMKNKSFYAVLG